MKADYVLISPCKDEAEYIERTLVSVKNQSALPKQWIIVDDGSRDNSMDIVRRYQAEMPYLKIITRNTNKRNVGPGVIEAFNEGLKHIDVPYDFICKLDADLDLSEKYFETLLIKMTEDADLGSCSGKAYYLDKKSGKRRSELCGDEASVGMTKFYRQKCFKDIGGFVSQVGWDGYDCHRARWFGWRTLSFNDADLQFLHLRPMGSSQKDIYRGRIRHGQGQYYIGTHPIFFLASSLFRSFRQKPYLAGSLCSAYGYFKTAFRRESHLGDKHLTNFIRAYQLLALRKGKSAAAEYILQQRRRVLGKTS